MHGLRSRAGTVALTACAFALLSVPVIALGKGPPEGKGGGPDTAQAVAPPQANVPDAPPGQLNKPAAPKPVQAPKPAPAGQAKPKPSAGPKPAPPGHVKRQATAPAPGNGRGPDASGPAPGGPNAKPPDHARARGHVKHGPSPKPAEGSADPASPQDEPAQSGSADEPSRSPSPEEPDPIGGIDLPSADEPRGEEDADADAAAAVVSDTVELPEDASPETLPFTGLQLALIALAGVAVMAGGLALRRTVDR
jgi:hypothetical protein